MKIGPQLALVDLLPISTRPPSQFEINFAQAMGNPVRVSITYHDPLAALQAIIEGEGTGPASSAIEDALRKSGTYKTWQGAMPRLKLVPYIHGFRNLKKHQNDVVKVNEEIMAVGGLLTKGQLLYRGGQFNKNEIIIEDGPISTSLMPSVARWHAAEVRGEIAVLRIAEDNAVRAFVFSSSGNQRHKDEYEVLLQSNIRLTQCASHDHMEIRVVEYEVFAINA